MTDPTPGDPVAYAYWHDDPDDAIAVRRNDPDDVDRLLREELDARRADLLDDRDVATIGRDLP